MKLPENKQDWSRANLFFQTNLNTSNINDQKLDNCVEEMNNVACNYFKDNCELANEKSDEIKQFEEEYKQHNRNKLKRSMKYLKSLNNPDGKLGSEIRFVGKLLRSMLPTKGGKQDYRNTDHDFENKKNFWSYTDKFLDEPTNILPSVDVGAYTAYFKKIFKCQNKKLSIIPSWMPTLPNGDKGFELEAPSYTKKFQKLFGE